MSAVARVMLEAVEGPLEKFDATMPQARYADICRAEADALAIGSATKATIGQPVAASQWAWSAIGSYRHANTLECS